MQALEALHTRNSVAMLEEPGPTPGQLEKIFRAGIRASDHRRLRPWKFILIEGNARRDLGNLMLEIGLSDDPVMSLEKREQVLAKPLRAPTIILVAAKVNPESFHQVPEIEQILSAAGAAQLMMAAAHAQGIGAIWRTGSIVYDDRFKAGVGLKKEDTIVGLLYMGRSKTVKPLQPLAPDDFVERWRC
jgi:nitroreductase